MTSINTGRGAAGGSANVEKARQAKVPKHFSMAGKVCVVTGGARGLGEEFSRAFLQAGSTHLAIIDLKEEEASATAKELVKEATADGALSPQDYKVIGIAADVADEHSLRRAFDKIIETFGRIDAVVANAGIVHNHSALDYPTERVKQLFDINILGVYLTAREAARHMVQQGSGSIVLIASMSATIVNVPQLQTPYNASKAAVKHMAASLGYEWAKSGVRVNALSPGYMLTKLTRNIFERDPELKKTWEALTPMGRMGNPEDLAGAIVYLASDASKFMTGAELRVDGGYCVI